VEDGESGPAVAVATPLMRPSYKRRASKEKVGRNERRWTSGLYGPGLTSGSFLFAATLASRAGSSTQATPRASFHLTCLRVALGSPQGERTSVISSFHFASLISKPNEKRFFKVVLAMPVKKRKLASRPGLPASEIETRIMRLIRKSGGRPRLE